MQARSGEDRIAQNPPVDTAASGDEESGHVRSDRRKYLAKLRSIEVMDLARDGPRGRDTRTDGRSRLGEGPRVVVDDEGTGPAIAEVGDAERTQRLEERRIEVPSRRVRLVVGTGARRHPRCDDPRAGSCRLPGHGIVDDGDVDPAGGEAEGNTGPGDSAADDADAGGAVDGVCRHVGRVT